MKKSRLVTGILVLLIALIAVFAFTACHKTDKVNTSQSSSTKTSQTVKSSSRHSSSKSSSSTSKANDNQAACSQAQASTQEQSPAPAPSSSQQQASDNTQAGAQQSGQEQNSTQLPLADDNQKAAPAPDEIPPYYGDGYGLTNPHGTLPLDKQVPVYASPDKSTAALFIYPAEYLYYDSYVNGGDEWWYSYVSNSGTRYYIAYSDVGY